MRSAPPTHWQTCSPNALISLVDESFTAPFDFFLFLALLFFSISPISSSNQANFKILLEFYEHNFALGILIFYVN